jgi:hypothetical protein
MKGPLLAKRKSMKEVSLSHMVREVDVHPSHQGSSLHERRFGFLLLKKHCRGFPYHIPSKTRKHMEKLDPLPNSSFGFKFL